VARKLAGFIQGFIDATTGMQSPLLFRKWAAVMCVAGALERKVWTVAFQGRITYPSMYVLLIGGPGVGKTEAIRRVRQLWGELPSIHVAPSSVSRASLVDALNEATRSIVRPTDPINPTVSFNSLQVGAYEFGTFLTMYEGEFMSVINDLWDGNPFREKKRGMKEEIEIRAPQLNILAGTTPSWLANTLPDQAWSEGFASRMVMVFSGERIIVDPFAYDDINEGLEAALIHDLGEIHNMFGQFKFSEEFVEHFRDWVLADCPPIPTHPKLEHYQPRRKIHFLKLCMIMCAQRGEDMIISLEDYIMAMDFFAEAEGYMPDVFKSLRTQDSNVMDEVYHYVFMAYNKTGKKPVSEHMIIRFIAERVPSYAVPNILKNLVDSHILEVDSPVGGLGGRPSFKPGMKYS
jgi:hypothetical protein